MAVPFGGSAPVRFAVLFLATALGLALAQTDTGTAGRRVSYSELPISFESSSNRRGDQFHATGRGYQLTLSPQEALVDLMAATPAEHTSIRLRMVDANPKAELTGLD